MIVCDSSSRSCCRCQPRTRRRRFSKTCWVRSFGCRSSAWTCWTSRFSTAASGRCATPSGSLHSTGIGGRLPSSDPHGCRRRTLCTIWHDASPASWPNAGSWSSRGQRRGQFVRDNMRAAKLIAPEDLGLFRVVHSAEDAVAEIEGFYRNYHSSRFVKGRLVLRLQRPLTPAQVDDLNVRFAHLCPEGKIEQRAALPEEADEPEVLSLPRLVVPYDWRSAGGLRQLIDVVNLLPT